MKRVKNIVRICSLPVTKCLQQKKDSCRRKRRVYMLELKNISFDVADDKGRRKEII